MSMAADNNTNRRNLLIAGGSTISTYGMLAFGGVNKAYAFDLTNYQDGPKGLKYLVTKEAPEGAEKPLRAQKVKTSYTLYINGFEEDGGKKIDGSKGLFGDKPFEFNVGTSAVIAGWDISLMDMKVGEARKLVIPSDLGYGDKGIGPIPGGATLYFDVELTGLGSMPTLNADQQKWLEEHPL